jgi:putative tricarboxylic transport membrane protein
MLIGILLGVLIGVLPGSVGANGVAILLPLTFTDAADVGDHHAVRASTGGRCSAVRSRRSCSTYRRAMVRWRPRFDGYPMAQKGRAGEALTAAFTSSFVGALFAIILITFLAPARRRSSR